MTNRPMGPRELARATGVSTDTLRHYERKRLVPGVTRTAAGYRTYPAAAVDRVLLIQRALVAGFSLTDLERILTTRDRGGAPCHGVRDLVGLRLQDLERHIQELAALRRDLRELLADWDARLAKTPPGERAHLLDTLGSSAVIERVRRTRERPPLTSARLRSPASRRTRGSRVGHAGK
jgi:DNA-binding transcriptional MerR regulator